MLDCHFRQAIERQRRERLELINRQMILRHIAIARSRRSKDHALDAVFPRLLEHMDGADDVLRAIELRIGHRDMDGRLPREVHDGVEMALCKDVPERFARHVTFVNLRACRKVFAQSRREIVHDSDLLTLRLQEPHEMRADEARAACHQDLHI